MLVRGDGALEGLEGALEGAREGSGLVALEAYVIATRLAPDEGALPL